MVLYSTLYALINCIGILIGGAAVFTALTGMSVIAGVFLLPVGVIIYTLLGGIKATFLTDYIHTIIIYAMVLTGMFICYTTSDVLGSPDRVYELLVEAAKVTPVTGNAEGSFLTMRSESGVLLGVVFWTAIFATTIDVQLFQKAIAAAPEAALPGYMIGGLSWFAIPFCLATTFGLAARALEMTPDWPTYPDPMTADQIAQGLAFPFAVQALMGTGGAVFVVGHKIANVLCAVLMFSQATHGIYGLYLGFLSRCRLHRSCFHIRRLWDVHKP